jgi:hypothetical protein
MLNEMSCAGLFGADDLLSLRATRIGPVSAVEDFV